MSEERYLIRKGGYYYRPEAQGYTNCIDQAGRYTLEDAISYSHPNGPDGPRDGITYEPAPPPPSQHREPIEADREAGVFTGPDIVDRARAIIVYAIRSAKSGDAPYLVEMANKVEQAQAVAVDSWLVLDAVIAALKSEKAGGLWYRRWKKAQDEINRLAFSTPAASDAEAMHVVREMLADGMVGAAIHFIDRKLATPSTEGRKGEDRADAIAD